MRNEDVLDEMERFWRGEVNTLLATQMVETGINILDLKYLIVIGAESFGNLNLYQLTGRVGRNGEQAFAYLMTCNLHRMKEYTEQVTSGYEAAKLDLVQRGAGSMDEAEQSGIVKIAKGEFITPEIIQIAADVYKNLNKNPAEKERASAELSAFFDRVF
jgi:transcription-repair coupling factor (superfamily II helicase)